MDMLNLPSENKASSSSIPPIFSNKYRNKVFYLITAFLLLIGICFATYYFLYGKYHQYTDDAYVNGNPIMITAQVPGIITKIYVQNTDYVEKDTPLVETDTTDFEISLDKCKQELANEIRLVASIFSKSNQLAANVEEKKSIFLKKVQDYERRVELAEGGSVSREDVDHSLFDMTSSYASLVAQEQEFFAAMTIIDGTSIASHPRVELAKQKVKKAWVDLKRCTLRAPISGIIAQKTGQIGKWAQIAQPLLSIVPLDEIWVDANFKETQLSNMRVGQPVELTSDMYGRKVVYQGTLTGVGGGTGSVFSVIPPQNASGNWIKITQRIPVRIDLSQKELNSNPLRLGLSMKALVTTKKTKGSMTPLPRNEITPRFSTTIYSNEEEGVDQVIEDILINNITDFSFDIEEYDVSLD